MRPSVLASLALLAAAAAAWAGPVSQLPVACSGRDTIYGILDPAGDTDRFTVFLGAGETLAVTSAEYRPEYGLLSTLKLLDPSGADVTPTVTGQGERIASFQYVAPATGTYRIELTSVAPMSGGTGNYALTVGVTRLPAVDGTFADPAGGAISMSITANEGATLNLVASTRKGGFDLTELRRPDGTPEPGFAAALKAKTRRTAKLRKFAFTGGPGTYELRGNYDAGSSVVVNLTLKTNEKARRRQLTYDEPRFDPSGAAVFPTDGIEGSVLFLQGFGFDDIPVLKRRKIIGHKYPTFTIGGVLVPPETVNHPNGSIYTFPVPPGLAENQRYDIQAVNADGQTALITDAFFVVPPPQATGLGTVTTAGQGGGRLVRILGQDLRSGMSVKFGDTITQPDFTDPDYTYLDVVAPAHAPGDVSIEISDKYGRVSAVPGTFTFLDVPFNRITSVNPAVIQAVGGQKITVNGLDFQPETVLTFDRVAMDATLVSGTKMEFLAPQHPEDDVQVRVTDSYDQTSAVTVPIRGFTDFTAIAIPAPLTTPGYADGWRATRVLVGDVTGDNNPDLVLLRPEPASGEFSNRPRVRLLVNAGNGTFADATSTKIPAVSGDEDWRAKDGVLFDMDGDGDLDLAIITDDAIESGTRSSLRILKNGGTGTFTDATGTAVPAIAVYSDGNDRNQGVAIAAAKVDGDADMDLVIVHTSAFRDEVHTPGGPPTEPPDPPPPDIVTISNYPATRVLSNNGSGVFTRSASALPAITDTTVNKFEGELVAVGDVTGGSGPDILITRALPIADAANPGSYLRSATLLVNDGSAHFTDATASKLPAPSDPEYLQANRVYFVDVDGDGDLDLALASTSKLVSPVTEEVSTAPATRFFANNGTGTFTAIPAGQYPAADGEDSLQADAVVVADYTGDSRKDLFVVSARAPNAGERATRIAVRNIADTAWQSGSRGLPSPAGADDMRGYDAQAVDFDGDGDLDLVIVRDEANESLRNTVILKNPR